MDETQKQQLLVAVLVACLIVMIFQLVFNGVLSGTFSYGKLAIGALVGIVCGGITFLVMKKLQS